MELHETHLGLPNTCSRCGRPAGPTWWADTVDAARAGQGLCADCAAPKVRAPDAEADEAAAQTEAERAAAEADMSADIPAPQAKPARRRKE